VNVQRLKDYSKRLILFPRKSNNPKKGDTAKADLSKVETISAQDPIPTSVSAVKVIKKSEMPKAADGGAYRTLRVARSNARLVGVREKRAKEKAEAESAKK
jgi:large subunit ribosomal protein L13e